MKKIFIISFVSLFFISCSSDDISIPVVNDFEPDFLQASDSDVDFIKRILENEVGGALAWAGRQWDFDNVMSLRKSDDFEAILVNQEGTSAENAQSLGFSFIKKDGVILSSFVVKTIDVSENFKKAEYYSFDGELLFTSEFNHLTKTIKTYKSNSDLVGEIFQKVSISQTTDCEESFGQNVVDCMDDVYTKRGFLSVWAWVQTAFIPMTAAAIAIDCIFHNWPGGDQCYDDFGWSN